MMGTFSFSGFNGDLHKWDVSNVTNMGWMFKYTYYFNGDISNWNVSKVTNMTAMFQNAKFNGDISDWNVNNVTNMENMFYQARFARDISKWDMQNTTYIDGMFRYNSNFLKDQDIKNCQLKNQYLPDNNCTL